MEPVSVSLPIHPTVAYGAKYRAENDKCESEGHIANKAYHGDGPTENVGIQIEIAAYAIDNSVWGITIFKAIMFPTKSRLFHNLLDAGSLDSERKLIIR